MPEILRISASQTSGAPNIIALVLACSLDGPPSTRYDATVNGAPANPISGVLPSSPTRPCTASVMNGTCSGVEVRDRLDVRERAHRVGHDRPDPGLDVEVDADRLERQHDVGEEDRRVDAVAAHRLHRDLHDQLGPHARLEHGDALAHLEVLRQRPPRLPHEPHRRVGRGLAPRRPEEGRVVQRRVGGGGGGHGPIFAGQAASRVPGTDDVGLTCRHGGTSSNPASSHRRLPPSSARRDADAGREVPARDLRRGDARAPADRPVRLRARRPT